MPALDTHSGGTSGVSNAFSFLMSTDTLNAILLVCVVAQSGSGAGADGGDAQVSSITDDAGLNWQRRSSKESTDGGQVTVELWWAPSPAKLANDTINVFLNRVSRSAVACIAVIGAADINHPFDANAGLPAIATYSTQTGASPALSTNQARTLILIACGVFGNAAAPAVSSPLVASAVNNGTYVTAFFATQARTAQANNVQSVVTSGGLSSLTILGDAIMGPGWLRYDTFTAGF